MTGALLVLLAAADAGFEPVVLDVHHGEVFESRPDGGFSDAPTFLFDATCMDKATTEWVAENKARARAERNVYSEWLPSAKVLAWTFGGALLIGFVGGLILAWQIFR